MGNAFCLMIGFGLSPPTFEPDGAAFGWPPVPPLSGELIFHVRASVLCAKLRATNSHAQSFFFLFPWFAFCNFACECFGNFTKFDTVKKSIAKWWNPKIKQSGPIDTMFDAVVRTQHTHAIAKTFSISFFLRRGSFTRFFLAKFFTAFFARRNFSIIFCLFLCLISRLHFSVPVLCARHDAAELIWLNVDFCKRSYCAVRVCVRVCCVCVRAVFQRDVCAHWHRMWAATPPNRSKGNISFDIWRGWRGIAHRAIYMSQLCIVNRKEERMKSFASYRTLSPLRLS